MSDAPLNRPVPNYEAKLIDVSRVIRELSLAVLDALEDEGLEPFISSTFASRTGESTVQIKFACSKLGSLRISDELCNIQYIPRWNLFLGKNVKQTGKYKSHWYAADSYMDLVSHMSRYHGTILRREAEEARQIANAGLDDPHAMSAANAEIPDSASEPIPLSAYVEEARAAAAAKKEGK